MQRKVQQTDLMRLAKMVRGIAEPLCAAYTAAYLARVGYSIDPDVKDYIDYKSVDDLRRLMTPNGKIYTRKRLGASAREQRRVAQAIKRARYMALLPYTSATL